MGDLATATAAIASRLAGILETHDGWPDQAPVTCPCAIVDPGAIEYDQTFEGDNDDTVRVELLVGEIQRIGYQRGRALLYPYLATSGTASIKAALETGQYSVLRARDIGPREVPEGSNAWYYGATFDVLVYEG